MSQTTIPTHSADTAAIQHVVHFIDQIFPEPRSFDVRLWDGTLLRGDRAAPFTIVLNSPGALRRMFHLPIELSLGEAYIRGDFDVEGDVFAMYGLLMVLIDKTHTSAFNILRAAMALPQDASDQPHTLARGPVQLSGSQHSLQRDQAAIQYHYDVSNEFYALFLDKRMVYSCAYFPTGTEDLDTAQERKLEHICRKLRLKPGERLLDIGCGWGGLIIYAAQNYGVTAVGVTLSQRQYELATQRIAEAGLSDRVTVRLRDYRALGGEQFDKLVSVGMFEHVGRNHLPEYFSHTYRLLKPGGLFLNHGIAANPVAFGSHASMRDKLADRFVLGSGKFARRYVFPDGELVPVSEANLIAENAGFEVRDVENLREHYALTLRNWVRRLDTHRAEAVRLTNETIYRTWRLYMSGSVYGFEKGTINVDQSLLAKQHDGTVPLPMSRADLYR